MCFLDDDDLRELLCDPDIFPLFKLTEDEQHVLVMHFLKGFTFEITGSVVGFSRQRAHQLYKRTRQKIKKQMPAKLKECKSKPSEKSLSGPSRY
jgi:DNA-directed RNA polymerase sigma subunit (sigma70/sigma32)